MRLITLAAVLLAGAAAADDGSDTFRGNIAARSLSASGFMSTGQRGDWSVGAMNDSFGFSSVLETKTGLELSTSGGSTSEGFGANFRGLTGAAGVGFGRGFTGFRGRF